MLKIVCSMVVWILNFDNIPNQIIKLSRRYTNHCIRVTMVTVLKEKGFSNFDICKYTGHKNPAVLIATQERGETKTSVKCLLRCMKAHQKLKWKSSGYQRKAELQE